MKPESVIPAGIATNYFFSAATSALQYIATDEQLLAFLYLFTYFFCKGGVLVTKIKVNGVCFSYGNRAVLNEVDMNVEKSKPWRGGRTVGVFF